MRNRVIIFLLAVLALTTSDLALSAETRLAIVYLELKDDPRYKEKRMEARFQGQAWGRPFEGAELAIEESRFVGSAAGVAFDFQRQQARDGEALFALVEKLKGEGVQFFLTDLPGHVLKPLAELTRNQDMLLFNVSALDDELRQQSCHAHLLHLAPSRRMLLDALAQFLVSRKWREVLVLKGSQPEDININAAFERSAKRYGLEIVDSREFTLGRDPRQRSQNNVALLTGQADYDAVFVADSDGEFARDVPYQTLPPRPVTGSAGLVPDWWHWAWERHGAPQLNRRFVKRAGRPMTGYDWAAWMGVKALVEAVLRTGGADFDKLAAYLKGPEIVLDGFKGNRLSFRPWDNQLRQPIFLSTYNWVVDRAPIDGFLHATNNLDTLGFDRAESECRFEKGEGS